MRLLHVFRFQKKRDTHLDFQRATSYHLDISSSTIRYMKMTDIKSTHQHTHINNWLLRLLFVVIVFNCFDVGENRSFGSLRAGANADQTNAEYAVLFNAPKTFRLFDHDGWSKRTEAANTHHSRFIFQNPQPPAVLSSHLIGVLLKANPGYSPTHRIVSTLHKQHIQNDSSEDEPPSLFSC